MLFVADRVEYIGNWTEILHAIWQRPWFDKLAAPCCDRFNMSDPAKHFFRYLPTSPRDREWGMYVVGAGHQLVPPGRHYPPKGHPPPHDFAWQRGRVLQEFQVVYISAGEGEFDSESTGRQSITAGTAIFVFPNVWHSYRPLTTTGWEEYWVAFHGEDATRLCQRGFIGPGKAVLHTGIDETILHSFTNLLDRIRSERIGFQQLIATDAMAIVANVLAAAWNRRTSSRNTELVNRLKIELEKDTEGAPVIETMAAKFHVSPSHLHHVFKRHSGLSPYQYHLQMKIHRARELLRGSKLSIKEVARMLSFQSVFHFSKLFKKKTGMSPRQWRDAGEKSGEWAIPPKVGCQKDPITPEQNRSKSTEN